jgi:hypothetical protein
MRVDAIITELDKLDIIIGQPWLHAINPDIYLYTKAIRHRKTGETIVLDD